MIKANVILDNLNWKNKIKKPNKYIKNKLKLLTKKKFFKNKNQEFSILLTNNKVMKNLNNKFRKKNKPTDVLSFPFENKLKNKKNIYLGDIAISYEFVNKRSKNSNLFFEFDKLWIHGYLHLLGYNHKRNKDYYKMKKLEDLILNRY